MQSRQKASVMRLHGTHYGRSKGKIRSETCSSADKEEVPLRGMTMRPEEKTGNSPVEAAGTPPRPAQAVATGLTAKPWRRVRPASAVAEAPPYSCSKSPCRNCSTNRPFDPLTPGLLARKLPGRFEPKRASD